jgi:hypothetical protein
MTQSEESDAPGRRVDVTDVLRAWDDAGAHTSHIAAFALEAEPGLTAPVLAQRQTPARMLAAFVGPYGTQVTGGYEEGIAWAGVLPEADQVLSTWSHYGDERGLCIVEGEFYSDAWGYRPVIGVDRQLAGLVMERVLDKGPEQIDGLNGVFSGAVFSRRHRRLWLFVDRLGARFLYYRATAERCEVGTSLYGFRQATTPPRVDAQALNEHLVLGNPTRNKTLFAGILLVPPATVIEWSEAGIRERRYYRYPPRREKQSLRDGAAMIGEAVDTHVKNLRLPSDDCSIALSGGKDSRVVLGALLRAGIRPWATTFLDGPDVRNALRLSEALGLSTHAVTARAPEWDPVAFDWESAILMDGYQAGSSFLVMAADAGLQTGLLFTGFGGFLTRGAPPGLVPWRRLSVEAVALREYHSRGAVVSPGLLRKCLRPDLLVPVHDIVDAFVEGFRAEHADSGDFLTTYLLHRASHRNRRRIAPVFHMMRICTAMAHPFADRLVMNVYLELPRDSVFAQGAHYLAAMYKVPLLGRVPADSSRLPLKYEFLLRRWRERAKFLVLRWRQLAGVASGPDRRRSLSLRHRRHIAMAVECGLFDPDALAASTEELAAKRSSIIKLGSTSLHIARVLGQELPSAPEPTLLKQYATRGAND